MTLPELPPRTSACPPAIDLERLSAGEPVPTLDAHVKACPHCSGYLAQLTQTAEAFVKARPPQRFLAQLEKRERPASSTARWVAVASAVAAVVLAIVTVRGPGSSGVSFKGSLVSITVKRGDAVSTLKDGETLREGDALRFSVKVDRPGHALVLERDGRGKVTVVAPFNAKTPQRVAAGSTVLDDSAVLDATVGQETFVTVFAEAPFEVEPLVRQLESNQAVSCAGCSVEASSFDKR